jgi:hypothetical protein
MSMVLLHLSSCLSAAGADIFAQPVASLFAATDCEEGACFLSAACSSTGGGDDADASLVAQPYFPTPLSKCALSHATITGRITSRNTSTITMEIASNTTAPYVFLSSTLPGRFTDNSFTLFPNNPIKLMYLIDQPVEGATVGNFPGAGAGVGAGAGAGADAEGWVDSVRIYTINNKAPTAGSVVFQQP